MKYIMKDVYCVILENGEIIPIVFNNDKTKIKNILTNEIYNYVKNNDRYFSCNEIEKSLEGIKEFPYFDRINKVITFKSLALECHEQKFEDLNLLKYIPLVGMYSSFDEENAIKEKDIKYTIKLMSKKYKRAYKHCDKLEEDKKEAEHSQEF